MVIKQEINMTEKTLQSTQNKLQAKVEFCPYRSQVYACTRPLFIGV